jgi:hypothetical protein
MSEDTQKHPGGRRSFRLYVLPDGRELNMAQLKGEFSASEVEAIVKRCQRHAAGHSIKYKESPPTEINKLPKRLQHLDDYLKNKRKTK